MKKPIRFFTYYLFFILLITSCQKDDPANPIPSGTSGHKVVGRVVDETGEGISGAIVSSNGKTAVTGSFGQFTINDVAIADNRVIVKCDQRGYFTGTATEIPSASGTTSINLTLQDYPTITEIDASAGGQALAESGSSVDLPANAIVDANGNAYSGTVSVALALLDPTTEDFGKLIQGADMQAIEEDGDNVTLYSYGILRVELEDASGNELQLASGKSATITVPIPTSMLGTAPATIPLWYFDETSGIWKEEGQAVKTGNEYIGTVTHFTDWNCDYPSPGQATISGTVVDCDNLPLANILVRTGQTYSLTDVNGKFSRLVPIGFNLSCAIEAFYNNGMESEVYNISPLSENQNFDLGNVIINVCPTYLTGTLIDCNNNPISGWIKLSNESDFEYLYTSNGFFKTRVNLNQNIHLTAYGSNGQSGNTSITTSSNPEVINEIGSLKICMATNIQLGENSFTITQDGLDNKVVLQINNYIYNSELDIDNECGIGLHFDNTLTSYIHGKNNINNSLYPYTYLDFFIFASANTGTINNYGSDISINFASNDSTHHSYHSYSYTVNINRYDEPGGLIEGTFDGLFYYDDHIPDSDNSDSIFVPINGKFSIVRIPDNALFRTASRTSNMNLYTKPRSLRKR